MFISIHHDSVRTKQQEDDPNLCQGKGGRRIRREFNQKYKTGFNVFLSKEMSPDRHEASLKFARIFGSRLVEVGRTASNYHVSRATKMPAVLVEVGTIADVDDEAKVNTPLFRKQFAFELKKAIDLYFSHDKTTKDTPQIEGATHMK